jgi:hypothetical protein
MRGTPLFVALAAGLAAGCASSGSLQFPAGERPEVVFSGFDAAEALPSGVGPTVVDLSMEISNAGTTPLELYEMQLTLSGDVQGDLLARYEHLRLDIADGDSAEMGIQMQVTSVFRRMPAASAEIDAPIRDVRLSGRLWFRTPDGQRRQLAVKQRLI